MTEVWFNLIEVEFIAQVDYCVPELWSWLELTNIVICQLGYLPAASVAGATAMEMRPVA